MGATVGAGLVYALADVPSRLTPAAAQALNVLDNDVSLTANVGGAVPDGFSAAGALRFVAALRGAP